MRQTKIIEFGNLEVRYTQDDDKVSVDFRTEVCQSLNLGDVKILVDWLNKEVLSVPVKPVVIQKQEPQPVKVKAQDGPAFFDLDSRKAVVVESKPTQFVGREAGPGDIETFDRGAVLKSQNVSQ